eukprot:1154681-Pyramimonas_sp.AAC.1
MDLDSEFDERRFSECLESPQAFRKLPKIDVIGVTAASSACQGNALYFLKGPSRVKKQHYFPLLRTCVQAHRANA